MWGHGETWVERTTDPWPHPQAPDTHTGNLLLAPLAKTCFNRPHANQLLSHQRTNFPGSPHCSEASARMSYYRGTEEKRLEMVPVAGGLLKTDPSFFGKDMVFRVEDRMTAGGPDSTENHTGL